MRIRVFAMLALLAGFAVPHVAVAQSPFQSPADEKQVAVEFRLVQVPEDCVEHIGVDFSQPGQPKCCTGLPCKTTKCLTAKELVLFLKAAQSDARTTITQAPKMTVLNGQAGAIDVRRQENGVRWHARPVISADGRFVQVAVDFESVNKPAATAKIEKKVVVPDGCTAIVGTFKKVAESSCECACPVLGQIPYMDRLFRTVGYHCEPMRVYVLMTPKIVHEAAEDSKAACCPPVAEACHAGKIVKIAGGCQACCGHANGCCPMPAVAMPCPATGPLPCPLCGAMPCGMPTPVWNKTWIMRPAPMGCSVPMPAMPDMAAACHGCCGPMAVAAHMPAMPPSCPMNACCAVAAVEVQSCAKPCRQAKAVAELVKAYDEACAAGHVEEAEKFAKAALTLDPMCFCHK